MTSSHLGLCLKLLPPYKMNFSWFAARGGSANRTSIAARPLSTGRGIFGRSEWHPAGDYACKANACMCEHACLRSVIHVYYEYELYIYMQAYT